MAHIKADEITQLLREQIQNYDSEVHVDEVGTIIRKRDGEPVMRYRACQITTDTPAKAFPRP